MKFIATVDGEPMTNYASGPYNNTIFFDTISQAETSVREFVKGADFASDEPEVRIYGLYDAHRQR